MKFLKIEHFSTVNGRGLRSVLWVSGCDVFCPGCHNKESWDFRRGQVFDDESYERLTEHMSKPYVDGLTILGGEPLAKKNIEDVKKLLKKFKEDYPTKTVFVWTGHLFEDIDKSVLDYVDVLIDGPFDIGQFSPRLKYRGSLNQRVIDVKKTLKENKIILFVD